MPVSAETLRKLMAAGLAGETLLEVVASIDADQFADASKLVGAPQRSLAAERQARYRERQASRNVTGDVTSNATNRVTRNASPPLVASPKKETPRTPKEKTTPPPKPLPVDAGVPAARSIFDVLHDVLDEKRSWAVIEHRKAMGSRGRMTLHAAELLAGKFSQLPDPNAGADAMISNGWVGFEVEWMENRRGDRRGPAPPATRAAVGQAGMAAFERALRQEIEEIDALPDDDETET